tara:strand:+ start:197 stop:340 length:144 start_codon:yes stop_codon:yes gene_type:complete
MIPMLDRGYLIALGKKLLSFVGRVVAGAIARFTKFVKNVGKPKDEIL